MSKNGSNGLPMKCIHCLIVFLRYSYFMYLSYFQGTKIFSYIFSGYKSQMVTFLRISQHCHGDRKINVSVQPMRYVVIPCIKNVLSDYIPFKSQDVTSGVCCFFHHAYNIDAACTFVNI